jgi:DNA-binding beta-propeller fold protein YncE
MMRIGNGSPRGIRRPGLLLSLLLAFVAVGAAQAQARSWQAIVVNDLSTSDSVSQIDTSTNVADETVGAGELPLGIAIAPDARTAYVVDVGSDEITPIDLSSGTPIAQAPISLADPPARDNNTRSPNYIAISPDGSKAYISDPSNDQIVPVNLTTTPATVEPAIDVAANPEGIAFSPDGQTAYVVDNDNPGAPNHTAGSKAGVTPITVAANSPGTLITGVGPQPFAIAVAPNGKTAYVTENASNAPGEVFPIDLSTETAGTAIPISPEGDGLPGIAITPDGSTAYVADYTQSTVVPIDLASGRPQTPIALSGRNPYAIAVTPDSKTVYVTDGGSDGDTVTPIAASTATPGTTITVGGAPRGIAITPDQGPVANFTVTSAPAGSQSSFDASCGTVPSCSTVPFGSIATYTWNFGDGSEELTSTTPTIDHVYAAAGSYTATVTESDGLASNLGEVFTGQTASILGDPAAQTSRSVVISPAGGPTAAPAVKLSTSALSFTEVGVGTTSAPQTVTLTNSGNAPLAIASVSIGGPQAASFTLAANGCPATLAAGASCTASVVFHPSAPGTASAQLAFTDNASGSPHVLSLSGVPTTQGAIAGTVTSATGSSAPAPLAGVTVLLCHPGEVQCSTYNDAPNGAYSIPNLTPGPYHIEFYPPTGSTVLNAAINVNVPAGPATNVSPTLRPPRLFPAGVTTSTPGGGSYEGLPVVYGNQPYQLEFPFGAEPAAGALKPAPPSPCVYSVLTVSLEFSTDPGVNGGATYSYSGTQKLVMVYDQNGPRGYTFETEEGNYLLTPTTQVVDQHVPGGGNVTWSIVGGGAALQVSFSGAEAIFGASGLQVHGVIHQHADFKNAWSCEVEEGGGEDESEGEQEVDPSGFVRSTKGVPLEHAKVTLQREGTTHKFTAPATGEHSVFDPALNPEFSDQLGHYGWNVVPGTYRTTVSHPKCTSVVSRTVVVPPPVTNLSVRLRCHGLSRVRTALSARVLGKPTANGGALLEVAVRSHGAKPQGEVRASVGAHVLLTPLNSRGIATVALAGLSSGSHTVLLSYLGDAEHTTAKTRVRVHVLAAPARKALPGHPPRL